ncbi:hypothetical protein M4I33_05015 [Clostridium sp. LY3-2]|uniref:hypothetical protein n=1 Tax=Clostridium sp. LY3-2 TaxID=2942482 RepID=UPI0021528D0C|nr:hypothetical protein [Clostridium sp. LY3-2]MCR6514241.1 hypothetical protein [Clostridium sp. LY3-2]
MAKRTRRIRGERGRSKDKQGQARTSKDKQGQARTSTESFKMKNVKVNNLL